MTSTNVNKFVAALSNVTEGGQRVNHLIGNHSGFQKGYYVTPAFQTGFLNTRLIDAPVLISWCAVITHF